MLTQSLDYSEARRDSYETHFPGEGTESQTLSDLIHQTHNSHSALLLPTALNHNPAHPCLRDALWPPSYLSPTILVWAKDLSSVPSLQA